jgi:glycosyltransferase involved in cell wall biosynthesis
MYSQEMQQCIDERVRTTPYDLAIAEHSFTGYYQVPPGLPLVVDQHNIESEIMQRASQQDRSIARRALNRVEFLKYRKDEQWICRRADLLLAVSERDRAAMQAWGSIPDCRVIPNGVDVRSFSSELYPDAEIEGNVVFTGTLHYGPNTEAVLHFGREIWPLVRERVPGAIFTVIGAHPPPEIVQLGSIPGITVQGLVPDVRPYLAGAQVVVAPLRYGGGTRLKILEAFAMKRAVVSTTVGYEGLDVTEGTHLLVADEPEAFAEKISVLLRDPSLREALGRAGRRLVEERYDWQAAGDVLEKALLDLKYKALSRSHPRRDP